MAEEERTGEREATSGNVLMEKNYSGQLQQDFLFKLSTFKNSLYDSDLLEQ